MINWNKPIRMRGFTHPVRFVELLSTNGVPSKAFVVYTVGGEDMGMLVTVDGEKIKGHTTEWDIINVKSRLTKYQNIYRSSSGAPRPYYVGVLYDTEQEAKDSVKHRDNSFVATVSVTFED